MTPKSPLKAFDGTTTSDVQVLNVPAGAIDPNGEIDLGQGIKTYVALVTQATTANPSATVLVNTLSGTPAFARSNTGIYTVTLASEWTANKTTVEWTNGTITDPTADGSTFTVTRTSANVLTINTFDDAGAAADWHVTAGTLRITVYP